jgi:antitoxin HigA-1
MTRKKLAPIHPGRILLLEFLEPMDLSQYKLAKAISVPARRINEIVLGKRAISADTAIRLGRYFGMDAQFWMNLQSRYDLEMAQDCLAGRLTREVTPRGQALTAARANP